MMAQVNFSYNFGCHFNVHYNISASYLLNIQAKNPINYLLMGPLVILCDSRAPISLENRVIQTFKWFTILYFMKSNFFI